MSELRRFPISKVPRVEKIDGARIKIYDNGGADKKGGSADRYTCVYLDCPERQAGLYECLGMSERPFHPQGVGMHSAASVGRHLGARIAFSKLPVECQRAVRQDTREIGKSLKAKSK